MVSSSINEHQFSMESLPWLMNGSLEGEDKARVLEHTASCSLCQKEIALLRQLQDTLSQGAPATTPTPDLDRIHRRIEKRSWLAPLWRYRPALAVGATAAAIALLIVVGVVNNPSVQTDQYRTVTSQSVEAGQIQVIFKPDFTAAEQQRLLRSLGLQVVAGPTAEGKFVLAPGPATPNDFAIRMQQSPGVAFASDPVTID